MKTKSMLRLMMTTISLIWLSSTAYGNDDHYHFNGRVAILVSNRSNIDENFCMGLLVAQDYVMAHVHCIQSNPNLTWAYFGDSALDGNGNSHDGDNYDYYDYDYDYDYEEEEEEQEYDEFSSDNSNLERGNGHKKEMDCIVTPEFCSDTEEWIRIKKITLHPEYQINEANVFVLIQLTSQSIQEPFKLLGKIQFPLNTTTEEKEKEVHVSMRAFSVKNSFMTGSRESKIEDLGFFFKYDENYCRSGEYSRQFYHKEDGILCLVASSVDKRYLLDVSNSFVMLEDKLAAISTCDGQCQLSSLNQFSLLSGAQKFIDETCTETSNMNKKKNTTRPKWSSDIILDIKEGDFTSLKGFLSGLRNSKSGLNFCSGSLIHPKFVLTAAHCVDGTQVTHVSVGSFYASSELDGEQIRVRQTLVHPNFDPETLAFDYALIELEYISIQPPIILDDTSQEEVLPGQRLTLYGYGASSGPTSTILQEVQLPVVGNKDCEKILQGPRIGDNLLCAGGEEGKDGCNGDSGGPLVRMDGQDLLLVGISSFGRGCGLKGIPAVYARLSHAKDFINKYVPKPKWRSAMRTNDGQSHPSGGNSNGNNNNKPSGSKQTSSGNGNANKDNKPDPFFGQGGKGGPGGQGGGKENQHHGSGRNEDTTDTDPNTIARNSWVVGNIHLDHLVGKKTVINAQSEYTKKTIMGTFLKSGGDGNGLEGGGFMEEYLSSNTTQYHKFIYKGEIELYSTYDLSSLVEIIAKYDARFLLRKISRRRFVREKHRLPHCYR